MAPAPSHYAWLAKTTEDVQAFYEAALQGGTDNGAPGPRDYHPGYYACFVLDPEGNNIEAVLHNYEGYNAKGRQPHGRRPSQSRSKQLYLNSTLRIGAPASTFSLKPAVSSTPASSSELEMARMTQS